MNRKALLRRLLAYTAPYRVFLLLSFLSALVSVALTLWIPVQIGQVIDCMVAPGAVDFAALPPLLVRLTVTILAAALFQWLMSYFINLIIYRTVKDLRNRLYHKLGTLPLSYIDSHEHGDIISRVVNDIDLVADGLLQGFTQLFTGVITILGTLFFMLRADLWVALTVILLTPLSLFVAAFIAKNTFHHFHRQSETQGKLSGYVEETVGNQKLIRAFAYEEQSTKKFREINDLLYLHGQKAQFFSSLSNPTTRFVNAIIYAAVGLTGALRAVYGGLTVGQISMFLSYANQYTKPFNEITGIIAQLQTAMASAERVFAVLDETEESPDAAGSLPTVKGEVTVSDLSFGYSPDRPLLTNFTLTVPAGSTVAIVGPTGCGKTTLINLLLRFYEPDSGVIRIDGTDISSLPRDTLRRSYGMVLQESWLFSGTVRENIAYGRPDATDTEIKAAAEAAYAAPFIRRLPRGYDTMISEDGNNLSQGQKQLLCIARVMLADPKILILDEATSNIDTRTEILVQRAFRDMTEGRTAFIVAHRLSTIKNADLILVMKDGKVVEQGTHETLLAKGGFYHTLYYSQFAT